jgi:hypothetical protein
LRQHQHHRDLLYHLLWVHHVHHERLHVHDHHDHLRQILLLSHHG